MKNINFKLTKCFAAAFFAVVFGISISATNANAQSASAFEIKIPFNFVVAGRTFSAGQYRIGRLDPANPNVLILKNQAGTSRLIVQAQPLDANSQNLGSMLTFDRFEDVYVLTGFRALGQTNQPAFAKADLARHKNGDLLETVSLKGN